MKRIISLILLLLFCLSSCVGNNVEDDNQCIGVSYSKLRIVKKIDKNFVMKEAGLEVNVGIGQRASYTNVTFTIYAPDFTIVLPNGLTVDEKYAFEYSDFDDEKYKAHLEKDGTYTYDVELTPFRFIYKGEDLKRKGKITFGLYYYDGETPTMNESEKIFWLDGTNIDVYYYIYGPFLKVSKKPLPL